MPYEPSDIEFVFSLLIIKAQLTPTGKKDKGFMSGGHYHPWSIYKSEALALLESGLSVIVSDGHSSSTIQLTSLSAPVALSKLQMMVDIHVLHAPNARPYIKIKDMSILQPTPKGCFLLQRFCRLHNIRDPFITKLLLSPYNSMQCITLPRNIFTNTVGISPVLMDVLVRRLLGRFPNYFIQGSPSDKVRIPSLASIYGANYNIFADHSAYGDQDIKSLVVNVSPLHSDFFTHPDSDSICQYYVSNVGVRMFRDKEFHAKGENGKTSTQKITNVITGKALYQWIMDCTDVVSYDECRVLVNMILKYSFLEPIEHSPSSATIYDTFVSDSRTQMFVPTTLALAVSSWKTNGDDPVPYSQLCAVPPGIHNPIYPAPLPPPRKMSVYPSFRSLRGYIPHFCEQSWPLCTDIFSGADLLDQVASVYPPRNDITITLDRVIQDPGLLMIFTDFLKSTICEENIYFYLDMMYVTALYDHLAKMKKKVNLAFKDLDEMFPIIVDRAKISKHPNPTEVDLQTFAAFAYPKIIKILSFYVSPNAPFPLNLSHELSLALRAVFTAEPPTYDAETLCMMRACQGTLMIAKKHIYSLLELDSLPKFINDPAYENYVVDALRRSF